MSIKISHKIRSIKIFPINNNNNNNNNGEEEIDPFQHTVVFTKCQWIQMALMSVTVAPIRFVSLFCLLGFAGLLSWIGLLGVSESDLDTKPLEGWRRWLQKFIYKMGRWGFFCMGIHKLKITGEKADRSEAPLLVSAPHATILDALPIFMSDAVPIAKDAFKGYFLIGTIGRFQQVLFVNRGKADARQDVREQIKARACDVTETKNGLSWRQLFIFPEGTTTNGRTLIKFKTGAFQSGLPVQMVLIRLLGRNHPDTLTWTWNQKPNDSWILLWMTLCQFNTRMEIEFLPVYTPSEPEKKDARLFADNVRSLMAKHLEVPTSEKRVEDVVFKPEKVDAGDPIKMI